MTSVLKPTIQHKRDASLLVDTHAFESIGSILRCMRQEVEAHMSATFDRPLSLKIDFLVAAEQHNEEDCD
jgi:hypothetical protein